MSEVLGTPLQEIYDMFFNMITDDMYLEMTEEETEENLEGMFMNAIPRFRFPRFDIENIDFEEKRYNDVALSLEEKRILALLIFEEWVARQINNVDVVRQMYTGSDFKATSQAAHLSTLLKWKDETGLDCYKAQKLYARRKKEGGIYQTTLGNLMGGSSRNVQE